MIEHLSVAFYPEHIREERWERDIALMKTSGINAVRVLEFAWSRLERADGEFDFAWVDRFMKLLEKARIKVVPCTPSAAPPAWITRRHPDCVVMDANGHRAGHGARRHYCPTSRRYRDYSNRIARKMQQALSGYSNILAWQLDNEFGWNKCYCPECNDAFRKFMKDKYQTLDKLNAAIGGAFWSEDFWIWEELELPRAGYSTVGGYSSPEMLLAFNEFYSDQITAFMAEQVAALRAAGCQVPISTNMMADFPEIDYWKMAKHLDVVGFDNYFDVYTLSGDSLAHNLIRSLKKGQGYWTFENQVDTVDSTMPTAPGFNLLQALSAMAHGEIGHTFFRWDSCRFAQEKDLLGLVDWSGKPRAKLLEIRTIRQTLDELSQIAMPPLENKVAIVFSYKNYWGTARYYGTYWEELENYYQALFDLGIGCDCVQTGDDLAKYSLVLAPGLQLVADDELENFRKYVRTGGVLLAGRKTFAKGVSGSYRESDHPALGDVFGIRVVETHGSKDMNDLTTRWSGPDISFKMTGAHGLPDTASHGWFETLELNGAESLYNYADGYYAGAAAASMNHFGNGVACYLGTRIGRESMQALMSLVLDNAKIGPLLNVPQGMQIVRRGNVWIATNHSGAELSVKLPLPVSPLQGSMPAQDTLTLPKYGWSVFAVAK